MKTKNIKVGYSNRYGSHDTTYPKIQMEGRWLEELGFTIGSRLVVEYEEGSIRIRPFTEEETAQENERQLLAEIAQKRKEYEDMQRSIAAKMAELPRVAEPVSTYFAPSNPHPRRKK